ncbi:MAG: hypothetical protein ACOY99_05930 [Pseudomonadota bacterium]
MAQIASKADAQETPDEAAAGPGGAAPSEKSQVRDPVIASRRLWPVYGAAGASLVWLILALGALYWAAGLAMVDSPTPSEIAIYVAGLVTPIVAFWMIALVFQRTDPLLERRLAVARSLNQAVAPIDAAEQRLDALIQKLNKELQTIDKTADLAGERIAALESRFEAQVSGLFSATAEAETSAAAIREQLQREREALTAFSSGLEEQTRKVQGVLEMMTAQVEDAADHARKTVHHSTERLAAHTQALGEAAAAGESRLSSVLAALAAQNEQLQQTTQATEERLDERALSLTRREADYRAAIADLSLAIRNAHEALKGDAESLAAIVAQTDHHAGTLRARLREEADKLAKAADTAAARTKAAAQGFHDEAGGIEARASATVASIEKASARLRAGLGETLDLAERRMASLGEEMTASGAAIEGRIEDIATRLAERMAAMNETASTASATLDEASASAGQRAAEQMATLKSQLSAHARALLDDAERTRRDLGEMAARFSDEMKKSLAGARAALAADREALDALTEKLGTAASDVAQAGSSARAMLETTSTGLVQQSATLAASAEENSGRIAAIESRIADQQRGLEALFATLDQSFEKALGAFTQRATALNTLAAEHRSGLETQTAALTERLARLKAALDATAADITAAGENFGQAADEISTSTQKQAERIDSSMQRLTAQRVQVMDELDKLGGQLTDACERAADKLAALDLDQGQVSAGLAAVSRTLDEQLSKVRRALREVDETAQQGAVQVGATYLSAMARARKVAVEAVDAARAASGDVARAIEDSISAALARLGTEKSAHVSAVEGEIAQSAQRIAARLEAALDEVAKAATRTGATAETAAKRVTGQAAQMMKDSENLTARIAALEGRLEGLAQADLVRTSSLIIEGLNSTAIDLNRALSAEVSDDLWASYLAGDKSIFTRKTVKLGDRATRAAIAKRYDGDGEFRDNVRRYLKDFELLMARAMAGRQASALSVALVSSELGKLYVLLAQSVKRLN